MVHELFVLYNWAVSHWAAISALLGGGATLSVVLQYLKHKLGFDSAKAAFMAIHLMSLATAFSAYYLANANVLPTYAGLAIAAQFIHRFVVSPYYTKYVLPYLTFLSEQAQVTPSTQAIPATTSSESFL